MKAKRKRCYVQDNDSEDDQSMKSESSGDPIIVNASIKKVKLDHKSKDELIKIEKYNEVDNFLTIIHRKLKGEELNHEKLIGNEVSQLPPMSGIHIDELGFLSLPLVESQLNTLKMLCNQLDDGVYCLEWSKIQFKNPKWSQELLSLSNDIVKDLGFNGNFTLMPQKLLLIEVGGSVNRQKLNDNFDNNEFVNLMIQLPCIHRGGSLIIYENKNKTDFDFGQSEHNSQYGYYYAAFDSNLEFEIQKVEDGYKILLIYSLNSFSQEEKLCFLNRHDASKSLSYAMGILAKPDIRIAIELEEYYDTKAFYKDGLNALEGKDLDRYIMLKEANKMLPKEKQFCFSIAVSSVNANSFRLNELETATLGHSCECDYCGYDEENESENEYVDDEAEDDYGDAEMNDDGDYDNEQNNNNDSEEGKVDENAHPSSKSKIIRPIDFWYDEDGNRIFEHDHSDLRIFTKIIHVSSEEPFVDNLDEENTWKRDYDSETEKYSKFMLVLWPKKYENQINIIMDPKTYIRSTYKELLCDVDANFDDACANLEVIIKEVCKISQQDDSFKYEHFYQILESLKFTQNEELSTVFLESLVFKEAYYRVEIEIISELVQLVKEIGIDKFKQTLFSIMHYEKNPERNSKLIIELYNVDEKEFAFECLKSCVLPDFNTNLASNIDDFSIKTLLSRNSNHENVLIAILLFKNDEKYKHEDLHVDFLTQIKQPTFENILKNLKTLQMLIENNQYGYAHKCFYENIVFFLKDENQFKELLSSDTLAKRLAIVLETLINNEPKYLSEIQSVFCQKIKNLSNHCESIDTLVYKLLSKEQNIVNHPFVQALAKDRIDYYDLEIAKIDYMGWKMPDAVISRHPEVEKFLKSEKEVFNYYNFNNIRDAETFVNKYDGFQDGYSIKIKTCGIERRSFVRIQKTTEYRDSLEGTRQYYEERSNSIKKLLN